MVPRCVWRNALADMSLLRQDAYAASQGSLPTACRFYCEQRLHVSAGCNREPCGYIASAIFRSGEVAEWLKAHAWKACIRETVSWVRIPPSPPVKLKLFGIFRSSHSTHNAKPIFSPPPPAAL